MKRQFYLKCIQQLGAYFFLVLIFSEYSLASQLTGKASIGVLAATGDMDLNDDENIQGINGRVDLTYSSSVVIKASLHAASSDLDYGDASNLRELYMNWSWDSLDFTLGRKVLPWGRADKFNPTDNLSPRIYRAVLTDDDEQRWGADIIKMEYLSDGPLSATVIWSPELRGHSLPRTFIEQFADSDFSPDAEKSTWAIKADMALEGIETSISYLKGVSLLPYVQNTSTNFEVVRPEQEVFGADFFISLNDYYGLRGEFARTHLNIEHTLNPEAPRSFSYAVVGIERQLEQGWLISAQYLARRVSSSNQNEGGILPLKMLNESIWFQTEEKDDALAIGLNRASFYGRFSGELGVIYSLSQDSYSLFGEVSFEYSENFSVNAYYTNYSGEINTNLGSLEKNQSIALEFRLTFGL